MKFKAALPGGFFVLGGLVGAIRASHGAPDTAFPPRAGRGDGETHQSIVHESATTSGFWANGSTDFCQSRMRPRSPRRSAPMLSIIAFICRRRLTSVFMKPTARSGWSSIASMNSS